jgi:hypothetical protein
MGRMKILGPLFFVLKKTIYKTSLIKKMTFDAWRLLIKFLLLYKYNYKF